MKSIPLSEYKKNYPPTEHQEQTALFQWFDLQVRSGRNPWLAAAFAIPNGARTSMSTAKKLKAEGMKGGVPDILIPIGRRGYVGLALEMKRTKGGKVGKRQDWWAEVLQSQAWITFAPAGWEVARDLTDWYFGLGEWPWGKYGGRDVDILGLHEPHSGPHVSGECWDQPSKPNWPRFPDAD